MLLPWEEFLLLAKEPSCGVFLFLKLIQINIFMLKLRLYSLRGLLKSVSVCGHDGLAKSDFL